MANSEAVSIVAGGHVPFGAHSQKAVDGSRVDTFPAAQMLDDVITQVLSDADIDANEIDGIWVGSCSPGAFIHQELLAPMAIQGREELRYKRVNQCTAACASGSVALQAAADAIQSGRADVALVVGIEKMSLKSTAEVTQILASCSYWPEEGAKGMTFPGLFAELAKAYRAHHNIPEQRFTRMLATVAASNYTNGVQNPLAHFGPGSVPDKLGLFTADAILNLENNPVIAPPLTLHDCSPISDGAAALLLTSNKHRLAKKHAVRLAGRATCTEVMPLSQRDQLHTLNGANQAMQLAYLEAGISAGDLDLIEVHDCFTSNQLLCLEASGISETGRAGEEYLDGRFADPGQCKVNLSGGLKSKGHPVGATGVSMHYFAYRQLIDRPVGQACAIPPAHAGVLNIGGSGVVSCASVLSRG